MAYLFDDKENQWVEVAVFAKAIGPSRRGVESMHRLDFYWTIDGKKLSGFTKVKSLPISGMDVGADFLAEIAAVCKLKTTDSCKDFSVGRYTVSRLDFVNWIISEAEEILLKIPERLVVEELSKLGVPLDSYPMGREFLIMTEAAKTKPYVDWGGITSFTDDD